MKLSGNKYVLLGILIAGHNFYGASNFKCPLKKLHQSELFSAKHLATLALIDPCTHTLLRISCNYTRALP